MVKTTTIKQLGLSTLSYNGKPVYKEGRAVSFSWNDDEDTPSDNMVNVRVKIKHYQLIDPAIVTDLANDNSNKLYLTNLDDPGISTNPFIYINYYMDANRGKMVDPTTGKTIAIIPDVLDGNGNIVTPAHYPVPVVDEFEMYNSQFPQVFQAIDEEVDIQHSDGKI